MSQMQVIGRGVRRHDALDKVTGAGKYTADVQLPGLLIARSKRSTVAHARIKRIDASRALALPGVKAVLTHENVPRILHTGSPHPRSASLTRDQYILDHKVRFWGETVAVVAATTDEIAEQAVDLIEVEYEELPAVFTAEDAMQPGAPLVHEGLEGVVGNDAMAPVKITRGDVEQGFAEADLVLETEFHGGRPTSAYMEPNVCTCRWENDGSLTVWISTQTGFMVRGIMAEIFGLPYHKVRVLMDYMGGGFGAKQDLYQSEFLCALLAQRTGRPVRLEYSREETFLGGRSRHPVKILLKQGFRKDGTITARQARMVITSGAYGSHGPGVTNVAAYGLTSLYRSSDNLDIEARLIYTNTPIAGAMRGFGVMQITYAMDVQIDEAAVRLGLDPADVKLLNVTRDGDIAASGHHIIGHGLEDSIRAGVEALDWKTRRRHARDTGVVRRGWGMGCEMHGSGADPAMREQGNAIIKLNEDGSAMLYTGTTNLGTGAHTTLAQIVAETIGLEFDAVSVRHGDTDVVPWDVGSFASHTTFVGGRAAQKAALEVKRKLLDHAAEQLEAAAADLEIVHGEIRVRGTDRVLSVRDAVAAKKGVPALQFVGNASHESVKSYSCGAHFAEVSVDTETGEVRVLQVLPVHEIGKVINPIGASGQVEGGIQQGIGHTLYEDYQIDTQTGRSLNPNFTDYKSAMATDMPKIWPTILLESAPDPGGPFGAKGIGEDPIIAIGPAIVNAIYDAIGIRFHHYPITPEQVLAALQAQKSRAPTEKGVEEYA